MQMAAMIMCGGASSRMGVDKTGLDWLGHSAVDRIAAVATELGAERIITVGGGDYGYDAVPDQQKLAGPVGGVLAGSMALRALGCRYALVLAVDAPTLMAEDLRSLCATTTSGLAFEGLHFPVMIELSKIPADAEAGWAMGRLLDGAGVTRLPSPPEARLRLRGANTPAERAALLDELGARQNAQSMRIG